MEQSRRKKWIPVMVVGALVVILTVVIVLICVSKQETYRIIKVYEVSGDAMVNRDGVGEMEAYQDMVLESGDTVTVGTGSMTLRLDDDKYVYVEEDTKFRLVADGTSSNSKTVIELESGAITNDIQNALGEGSSYEVNAPNSNMSVRGTVYRVYTYYVDGIRYTKVSVFEGTVESKLLYADGTLSSDSVMITNGKEVIIYDDDESTDYVGEPREIDYDELPDEVVELIKKIMEERGQSDVLNEDTATTTEEMTTEEVTGSFVVTFMYKGSVFGTQTVEMGGQATEPSLAPAPTGGWDFDFQTEINSDTVIEWK